MKEYKWDNIETCLHLLHLRQYRPWYQIILVINLRDILRNISGQENNIKTENLHNNQQPRIIKIKAMKKIEASVSKTKYQEEDF